MPVGLTLGSRTFVNRAGLVRLSPSPHSIRCMSLDSEQSLVHPAPHVLVTDLDNTLWDWFRAWHASFDAMLDRLSEMSEVPRTTLEAEIKTVHQRRSTSEYSNLLNELPSLHTPGADLTPIERYDEAIHLGNSKRRSETELYPRVKDTLTELKRRGVTIVAYTESISYWTEWRIKHTQLDGVIDVLYSAPDHDLPSGTTFEDLRRPEHRPIDDYGLKATVHKHVPREETKPNPQVLAAILADLDCDAADAIYVGDSLMKDVAMAQAAGVLDVHARYGEVQHTADYDLLRRVSHWPDVAVRRERDLITQPTIFPTVVLDRGFYQLLEIFDTPIKNGVTLDGPRLRTD